MKAKNSLKQYPVILTKKWGKSWLIALSTLSLGNKEWRERGLTQTGLSPTIMKKWEMESIARLFTLPSSIKKENMTKGF